MPEVKRNETEVTYDLTGLTEREAEAIWRLGGILKSKDSPLQGVYSALDALLLGDARPQSDTSDLGTIRAHTQQEQDASVYLLYFESQEQTPHQRGMLDVDEHGRWPDWDGPPRDVTDTRRKF